MDNIESKVVSSSVIDEDMPEKEENTQSENEKPYSAEDIKNLMDNPHTLVGAMIGTNIQELANTPEKQEEIKKTAEQILNSSIKTKSLKAQSDKNTVVKNENETYFELHKAELKTGGIDKATKKGRMKMVVATNTIWYVILFVTFLWWVIGINTFYDNIKPLGTAMKVVSIVISVIMLALVITGVYFGVSWINSLR